MRHALLIFALLASPALALDTPPDEPSFDQPSFDRPDPPEPPQPPEPPDDEDHDEEPEEPPVVFAPPKAPAPGLRCYFNEDGKRIVAFNTLVEPEMYKMGRRFCKKVPHEVVDISLHCVENNSEYRVQLSQKLSSQHAIKKAKRFCICVFGLD